MKVLMFNDHEAMSRYAAKVFTEQLQAKPNSVLGLATGSTPIELYQYLIDAYQAGQISFKDVTVFNLDEYLGIDADHPESYARFMREKLFDAVDMDLSKAHIPNGMTTDPDQEGRNYEASMKAAGGIDLQVLGLGVNSHIGFNEPDDELFNNTHATPLTPSTREANARFFGSIDSVPTHAVTMGVGSIMRSRRIILLASGEHKAEAIQKTVDGMITTQAPSSLLQLHPNALILIDKAAGALLKSDSYEVVE